jgi:hypothetical protein
VASVVIAKLPQAAQRGTMPRGAGQRVRYGITRVLWNNSSELPK